MNYKNNPALKLAKQKAEKSFLNTKKALDNKNYKSSIGKFEYSKVVTLNVVR